MLPLGRSWYRRLLGDALGIGLVVGFGAVAYMAITGAGSDLFFDDAGSDWWSGQWWWIPLVAAGGAIVALLRHRLSVPDKVPGAVAFVTRGWLEPTDAVRFILISAVSLIFGASLGPSFGLIALGGGLGGWIVSRFRVADAAQEAEVRDAYSLTGMAGGVGGAFTAPVFGSVLISELSPTPTRGYVAAFIPQLISATLGFVVFYGITGSSMLDAYELPSYAFEFEDLLLGALLGLLAVVVLFLLVVIMRAVTLAAGLLGNPYARAIVGGAIVGLIAFALPLTLTSGSSQLATLTENLADLGVGFVAAVLVAKMLAVAISLRSGFLGGNVFPAIFIGGTAGLLVHLIVPDIPVALAVAAMMAAVPGSFLGAPLSLILVAGGTVGVGASAIAPIAVAVVVAYSITAGITQAIAGRTKGPETAPGAT